MGEAEELRRAAELVARARRGVAFTGAGISAESGIQTFRGQDGLWKQHDPYRTASLQNFMRDPTAYWTVSRERWPRFQHARPNPAHLALAELEGAGHLVGVVTQNTDGLHREAGTRRLIELHGTGGSVSCLDCGATEPRGDVQARLDREMPPVCRLCGGRHLKPRVVFFGESLPGDAIRESFELAAACDLMLVVGSTLLVHPAAEVPQIAAQEGAPVLVLNDEPTPMDARATVVLRGRAGEILPELAAAVRQARPNARE